MPHCVAESLLLPYDLACVLVGGALTSAAFLVARYLSQISASYPFPKNTSHNLHKI